MSKESLGGQVEKNIHPKQPERIERPVKREKLSTAEMAQEAPAEAREAVHKALEAKKERHDTRPPTAERQEQPHTISHELREQAFTRNMADVQKRMSAPSRTFSKFIHNHAVEDTSEVIGKTIARPTSVLYGSMCAFAILLVVYLLAKHNGFALSGSEFIGLFIVGWLLGLLIDFFRHMITGK